MVKAVRQQRRASCPFPSSGPCPASLQPAQAPVVVELAPSEEASAPLLEVESLPSVVAESARVVVGSAPLAEATDCVHGAVVTATPAARLRGSATDAACTFHQRGLAVPILTPAAEKYQKCVQTLFFRIFIRCSAEWSTRCMKMETYPFDAWRLVLIAKE